MFAFTLKLFLYAAVFSSPKTEPLHKSFGMKYGREARFVERLATSVSSQALIKVHVILLLYLLIHNLPDNSAATYLCVLFLSKILPNFMRKTVIAIFTALCTIDFPYDVFAIAKLFSLLSNIIVHGNEQ